MWRRSVGNVGIVMTAAFVLSACGTGGEATVADSPTVDTAVVVDEALETSEDAQPEALALRENDAGTEEVAESADPSEGDDGAAAAVPPESLPPIDELDAGLAEFASCLNDNGVDVAPFTLQDMVAKASGMPLVETRPEMFAFFLDTDGTDPTFIAAVDACNPIVDAIPGLGAFLPDA